MLAVVDQEPGVHADVQLADVRKTVASSAIHRNEFHVTVDRGGDGREHVILWVVEDVLCNLRDPGFVDISLSPDLGGQLFLVE